MARPQKFDENVIVTKAMMYFWEHGYSSSSIQALLDEMGISRSSLYNSIGDKDALFQHCLAQFQSGVERLIQATLLNDALPSKDRAVQFLTLSFSENPSLPTGCLMVNTLCEDDALLAELKPTIARTLELMESGFLAVFEDLLDDKNHAVQSARLMATQIKGARVNQRQGIPSSDVLNDLLVLFDCLSERAANLK